MNVEADGKYVMTITYHADGPALAQIPISIIVSGHKVGFVMVKATEGEKVEVTLPVELVAGEGQLKFVTTSDALKIDLVKLYR